MNDHSSVSHVYSSESPTFAPIFSSEAEHSQATFGAPLTNGQWHASQLLPERHGKSSTLSR